MLTKTITTEKLTTRIYDTRAEMGEAAATAAADAINAVIAQKGSANVIFAAAPSQNEMLLSLLKKQIDFSRVNAFHMDEYAGLGIEDEQSFARYLSEHIFSLAPFASVNYIPAKGDIDTACTQYTDLLAPYTDLSRTSPPYFTDLLRCRLGYRQRYPRHHPLRHRSRGDMQPQSQLQIYHFHSSPRRER